MGTYISRRVLRDTACMWVVVAMAKVTFEGTKEARSVSRDDISMWVPVFVGVSREIMCR